MISIDSIPPCGRAALKWADADVPVLPLEPGSKRPHKRLARQGVNDATTDRHTVLRWWERAPDAWLGVRTGDGLVVVDIDPRNGGRLEALKGPRTRLVRTRSGGLHLYYFCGEQVKCRNGLLPGIDIKGGGGYVVAPPTPGYAWLSKTSELPFATASAELFEPVGARGPRGSGKLPPHWRPYEPPVGTIPQGERNQSLARHGGWLVRQGLSPYEVERQVCTMNAEQLDPPLDDDEVTKIIESVERYRGAEGTR